MTAEVLRFPQSPRIKNRQIAADLARRKMLSQWLEEIATWIKTDDILREPHALLLVLASKEGDEVVWKGFQDSEHVSLKDAGTAAYKQVTTPYARRGGNFHDRTKRS